MLGVDGRKMSKFIVLIWCHFVGDFLLQPRIIAENKLKNYVYLIYHCLLYTLCLAPFGVLLFMFLNGVAHFIIDFVTSKITSSLWEDYELCKKCDSDHSFYLFFTVIGLDQVLHLTCLILLGGYFKLWV